MNRILHWINDDPAVGWSGNIDVPEATVISAGPDSGFSGLMSSGVIFRVFMSTAQTLCGCPVGDVHVFLSAERAIPSYCPGW